MSFVSTEFAALFAVVLIARWTAFRRGVRSPGYLPALALTSAVFYGWHVPAYLGLIAASTLIDYGACRWLARLPGTAGTRRRLVVAASLVANLGLLGVFKYGDFAARQVGLRGLELALPIGISFYTFQSISCTIDVYRGRLAAPRSLLRFAVYVAFFPQLVAGPIVRAREFLYQLDRPRRVGAVVASRGVYLLIEGLFLKLVCADGVARTVDGHWGRIGEATGVDVALLALAFAVQIFCDFAGYSRIARGVAYLLGFRLPRNFGAPYAARSLAEFWRHWHISLSTWFRDYLYVPLGGNRRGRARTYVNLAIVMLLAGLWHGAAWTFVAWGAWHGVALMIERAAGLADPRGRGAWGRRSGGSGRRWSS